MAKKGFWNAYFQGVLLDRINEKEILVRSQISLGVRTAIPFKCSGILKHRINGSRKVAILFVIALLESRPFNSCPTMKPDQVHGGPTLTRLCENSCEKNFPKSTKIGKTLEKGIEWF